MGGGFDDALNGAQALLYGRRTWQTMAAAWPGRAGDPFAYRMNSIPKYVVSATLRDEELTWENTTRIPGDGAVARIRELRETERGDLLVMGSPTLVRALLREGLVDELRLMVMPVLLGGARRSFSTMARCARSSSSPRSRAVRACTSAPTGRVEVAA